MDRAYVYSTQDASSAGSGSVAWAVKASVGNENQDPSGVKRRRHARPSTAEEGVEPQRCARRSTAEDEEDFLARGGGDLSLVSGGDDGPSSVSGRGGGLLSVSG